ncbi:uncharacterized protein LOC133887122 [Phragmites australis]|uniref:uncharacterized protein LOC133887122 n=1 Tax=Phragmites australis TaxID=29695 RepID=UPI002D78DFCD|nr:uncharacterized protein LOC133887122 [Phragmites australis]
MAAIISKEEPLQLKQGSKVSSKLFSRESSAAAPSFRVYYGVASAGSVPFLWESQPGTPKNAISTATLPPLTPPPSYYTAKQASTKKSSTITATTGKKQSKHSIFSSILSKIILHRRSRSSSSSSPSSSSCSSSSWSSASFHGAQSPACSSMRSRVHAFSVGDDSEEEQETPTCFSVRHESFRAFMGCRVAMTVRNALASVGSHGSTAAAATAAPRV